MHLLDTDTLTHLLANHPRVLNRLREVDDPNVGITIVTRIEMLQGRFDFLMKAANGSQLRRAQELLIRSEASLAALNVIPVDEAAAAHFDRLRMTTTLRKLRRADLLIASVALAHNAVLVTRNLRHFRLVPRLRVANWVD